MLHAQVHDDRETLVVQGLNRHSLSSWISYLLYSTWATVALEEICISPVTMALFFPQLSSDNCFFEALPGEQRLIVSSESVLQWLPSSAVDIVLSDDQGRWGATNLDPVLCLWSKGIWTTSVMEDQSLLVQPGATSAFLLCSSLSSPQAWSSFQLCIYHFFVIQMPRWGYIDKTCC